VSAEAFRMSRCSFFERLAFAQPQAVAIRLDATHRLAFDIEGSHLRWCLYHWGPVSSMQYFSWRTQAVLVGVMLC
jgi:hypothetical protein